MSTEEIRRRIRHSSATSPTPLPRRTIAVPVKDAEALCDLADAAPRNLACERLPERVSLPPNAEVCGRCTNCRFNAALARLDGSDAT